MPVGRPLAPRTPPATTSASVIADAERLLVSVFAPLESAAYSALAAPARATAATFTTADGAWLPCAPVSSSLEITSQAATPAANHCFAPCFDVEVRETPGKGRGLFALRPFLPGDVIFCEPPRALGVQEVAVPGADEVGAECQAVLTGYNAKMCAHYGMDAPEAEEGDPLPLLRTAACAAHATATGAETTCCGAAVNSGDCVQQHGGLPVRTAAVLCDFCLSPVLTAAEEHCHVATALRAYTAAGAAAASQRDGEQAAAAAESGCDDSNKDEEPETAEGDSGQLDGNEDES